MSKGLRKKELAQRAGVSPGAISQYEKGTTKPSSGVVSSLALALGVPVDFFVTHRDIDKALNSVPHFRSLRSASQLERHKAFAHALLTWELALSIQKWVRLPELSLPEAFGLGPEASLAEAERAADALREIWELGEGPIPNMTRLVELHGIAVTRLPLETARVQAFSCSFPGRPVIVLNRGRDSLAAGRLDVAHELGHLVLHDDEDPGSREVERQAFAFGSAFLMPRDVAVDLLPASADFTEYLKLKAVWGLSLQALLFRARSLRVMSESTYRRAMTRISKLGWKRNEPGDDAKGETPTMLARALDLLSNNGVPSSQVADAARLPLHAIEAMACLDEQRPPVFPKAQADSYPEDVAEANDDDAASR
jgi:Zn-dependent peptidase ImmA (M78 family)/DNA-binding XRE family transcriptional regulator